MSKVDPYDETMPATGDGRAGAAPPGAPAPRKRRNPWVWISVALAVVAAGLLIWALSIRSDLDSKNQDVAELESQVEQSKNTGSTVVAAAKGLFDNLTQQLGATSEDLANTQQELDQAEQTASQAQQAADAAEQVAADTKDATAKAKAEADQAKAELQVAESKATTAGDCAKAYVSAFGSLLEGDSLREQARVVRDQLQGITADCKAALGGG